MIAFEVDLLFTNNLQNDIVVKYRVYEIQLPLNFKYKLDITVCSNFKAINHFELLHVRKNIKVLLTRLQVILNSHG